MSNNKPATIGIATANFNRPKILSLFGASIKRLREEVDNHIQVVVSISEEVDIKTCERYDLDYIFMDNNPVSEKFNKAVEFFRQRPDVDYVMITGSDDVISSDTFRRIHEEASKCTYDLIGVDNIYFYASNGIFRGHLCRLQAERELGVGKTISRNILDKVDWRLWHKPKNWGLDALVSQTIAEHVKSSSLLKETIICDVKSETNINKATLWMNKFPHLDPDIFLSILSDEEKQILFSL